MQWYYALGIVVATLVIIGMVGGAVVRLVRKHDKMEKAAERASEIGNIRKRVDEHDKRIAYLETGVEKAFAKVDVLRNEIKGDMEQNKIANSLILEGIKAIMDASPEMAKNEKVLAYQEELKKKTYTAFKTK